MFLLENDPDIQQPDDLVDPATGEYHPLEVLKLYSLAIWSCRTVEQVALRYGYRVNWSAPYWSEGMPLELYWANLKTDYRGYAPEWRTGVQAYVHKFAAMVDGFERKGMVEHIDKFCEKVLTRDPSVLSELELQHLATLGAP
jgi:hypothetical protein